MNNKIRSSSLTKASQQINAVTALTGLCTFGGRPVPASSVSSFYQLSAPLINGRMEPLSRLEGRVCLVVNMASADPATRQELMQLNDLMTVFGPHGLSVLVFPCNQFGGLEPFYNDEIPLILQNVRPGAKFETKFQLFAKCEVNGSSASPIYEYLKVKLPLPINDDSVLSHDSQHPITWKPVTRYDVSWNYEKFLVCHDGQPSKRFTSKVSHELIRKEVESCLRKIPKPVREHHGFTPFDTQLAIYR